MKYLFIYILLISIYVKDLHGQNRIDTIYLPEVELTESRIKTHSIGSNYDVIKPFIIGGSYSRSFADFLSSNTSFYIKKYGALATPTFRGTSSSHTLMLWNGVPLNSITNGILDFSTMHINNTNEIITVHGGNSTIFGSGAMGGTIHVNALPKYNDESNKILLTREISSFGLRSNSIRIRHIKDNFFISGSYLKLTDDNDFEYINTTQDGNPIQVNNYGAKESEERKLDAAYKFNSNHEISANYWYNYLDREVPQNMTTTNSDAKQYDDNTRMLISSKHQFNNFKITLKQAYLKENFRYTEVIKDIDSKFLAESKITDIDMKLYSGRYLLNIGSMLNKNNISNNNYLASKQKENQVALFSSIQYNSKLFKINTALRKEWETNYRVPLLPSFAIELDVIQNTKIRAKYNRNFRAPTFNDRFWIGPWSQGNINLKSEEGENIELGINYSNKYFNYKLTAYSLYVTNWIMWQEEDSGIWMPDNIKEVWSRGIEAKTRFNYRKISIIANYAYTKSTSEKASSILDQTVGKQLRYVPVHKGNILCLFTKDNTQFIINRSYTGDVITSYGSEKNEVLNDFFLTDIGLKYSLKNLPIWTEIKVNNIMDMQYQTYQNYPSPGREFLITINYTIK
tara:strand:- start:635 stop:2512 length:1878 start_codon:yes stop_codon:yes gene_type:complete